MLMWFICRLHLLTMAANSAEALWLARLTSWPRPSALLSTLIDWLHSMIVQSTHQFVCCFLRRNLFSWNNIRVWRSVQHPSPIRCRAESTSHLIVVTNDIILPLINLLFVNLRVGAACRWDGDAVTHAVNSSTRSNDSISYWRKCSAVHGSDQISDIGSERIPRER